MSQRILFLLLLAFAGAHCSGEPDLSVTLTWQADLTVKTFRIPLEEGPLPKEPRRAGGCPLRGYLDCHTGPSGRLGFLWDWADGRLYLDVNGDGDLTNDPNYFCDAETPQAVSYAGNQHVARVQIARGALPHARFVFDVSLRRTSHGGEALFVLKSAYSGELNLQGQSWILTVADTDLNGRIDSSDELFLRLKGDPASPQRLPIPGQIFVGDTNYRLDIDSRFDGSSLSVTLRCEDVSTGMLELQARGVQTLVLTNSQRLVWLEPPAGSLRIPAGRYAGAVVELGQGPRGVIRAIAPEEITVNVPENGTGRLWLGAPLTHHVRLTRCARVLSLNHELRGVGDERYAFRDVAGNTSRPGVTVCKGPMTITSGRFAYG